MLTTDLALRLDPIYGPISKRFHENPDQFADAFARAWFKLNPSRHGSARTLSRGPLVPQEELLWQDPLPAVNHPLIDAKDAVELKAKVLASGLTVSQLVATAWASASTFRGSTSGAGPMGRASVWRRQRTGPSISRLSWRRSWRLWKVSGPAFNAAQPGGKKVSLADLIVLAGSAAVEKAAKDAGHDVEVPFTPGRTGRFAGSDRRRVVLGAGADRRWVSRNYLKTEYT